MCSEDAQALEEWQTIQVLACYFVNMMGGVFQAAGVSFVVKLLKLVFLVLCVTVSSKINHLAAKAILRYVRM